MLKKVFLEEATQQGGEIMGDDALTVAKEITLATIPKLGTPADTKPEAVGERYGKLFKVVLKQVVEGINEANK